MESNDMEILVKLGAAVVGGAVLGGLVGGPGVAVLGGAAGGAVAVAALRPKQQEEPQPQPPTDIEPTESVINRPSPPVQPPLVPENAKQSSVLVLVISASQAELLESLKNKKDIDVSEGKQLYQITRYLWLGTQTELSQKRDCSLFSHLGRS